MKCQEKEGRGRRRRILSPTLHSRSPCSSSFLQRPGFSLEVLAAGLTVTSVLFYTWAGLGQGCKSNQRPQEAAQGPLLPAPEFAFLSSSQSSLFLVFWPERQDSLGVFAVRILPDRSLVCPTFSSKPGDKARGEAGRPEMNSQGASC